MAEPHKPQPTRLDRRERLKRRRERLAIVVVLVLFALLSAAEYQLTKSSSTLPFLNSIFFFGLLNINIVLLIALIWLITRNIGKLFVERRARVLGARLKTKLVLAFLAFSITPTLILFFISSLYINSSFDKWFSIKIQNTLQASLELTKTYYKNADRTSMHFASHIATQLGDRLEAENGEIRARTRSFVESPRIPKWVSEFLQNQRELLALHAVEFYADPLDERVVAAHAPTDELPAAYPRLSLDLLDRAFAGEHVSVIHHVGTGDLIRTVVPVRIGRERNERDNGPLVGVVTVDTYIPVSLVNKVDEIATVFGDYKETNPLIYPIKTQYFVILIMMTLVIIAVAIWMGLYLARELTDPVEKLVRGAREVGRGNLDFAIESSGQDEIAVLIESFNKMTSNLKENRAQLDQASRDLEKRRLQLETVLANIGAGVIVVDSRGEIATFNRAAMQLLGIEAKTVVGQKYNDVFSKDCEPVAEVIRRAFGTTDTSTSGSPAEVSQWTLRGRALAAIATTLRGSDLGLGLGVVVVIDDISHLVKSQREMAWREVARRIAHEIKNPLTPIKLSAQRLQRRLGHYAGEEGALLKECTNTIVKHTDELKEMVNEFSNFARLPEANPAPHDLNEVLREVVTLYTQAHPRVAFRFDPEKKLPIFEFDRDQIKRVVINLLDNAVAALRGNGDIHISTHYNDELQLALLAVEDNGPGITEELKSRIFEPYFSTKKEGTGLGLAIAKRIVNDHNGFIRVQSEPSRGCLFTVELPTSTQAPRIESDRPPFELDANPESVKE